MDPKHMSLAEEHRNATEPSEVNGNFNLCSKDK